MSKNNGTGKNLHVPPHEHIKRIAAFLDEHKGRNTVALYIGETSTFTDYFVITTINSPGHLRGLFRQLKEFLAANEIEPLHGHKKYEDERWVLIDCGDVVLHLMDEETRDFYELEKLWFKGVPIYP
jgi:ribosome-associated protein